MPTLTITAKGQVTFNKDLLRHLGLKPGDQLEISKQAGNRLSVAPAAPVRTGRMEDAFGILARPGQKVSTVEEMDEAIGRAIGEDDERIVADWRTANP